MPRRSGQAKGDRSALTSDPKAPKVSGPQPGSPNSFAPPQCFLSHSHHDKSFAYLLERVLGEHAVEAWYAPRRIRGSQQWHDEIGEALSRCNWFLLVLSPPATRSIWGKRELLYALNRASLRTSIVPIMYRNCDYARLSWTLDSIQMVDFRKGRESGFRDLLRIWNIEYRGR